MELGGNIELIGFSDTEISEMIVLKKIIGNYARKFADALGDNYEKLVIDMKKIHGKKSSKFEIQAKLHAKDKSLYAEVTENNLFVCIADAMKKIEAQISK